ncbi:dihydrofolate reductase family protein [Actinopolymorpha pittospori]|uniref:Dihydrofolate reductase n=1 Tax=Actinopolymorpha pittospori TaxID=648752 RepID=A0A927RHK1_9ACTN|nr:dihydrofolate reductase family protein [Actinopolymorpha pittospori]MBE1605281.1 dihydrofolate reductase [Actinopolymorpha pittospori]
MSRVVVVNFLSLDGVMQSVLSPEEDPDGGFAAGGWVSPHIDDTVAGVMADVTTKAGALLLGRRTYEIFAAQWPYADDTEPAVAAMNRIPKYVASRTISSGPWNDTRVLGADVPAEVADLRSRPGGDIVVFGSGQLIQTLIEHSLVDEYRLLVFPLVIGSGKRMFREGGAPANLRLVDTLTSGSGVVIATYHPATAPGQERS